MTEALLLTGISNLCCSAILALVAWAVQRGGRRPLLAHLLWVLVLVKLVTPPLVTLPMVAIPGFQTPPAEALPIPAGAVEIFGATVSESSASLAGESASPTTTLELFKPGLVLLWLLGSAGILVWSLVRIYRFGRLLEMASREAPLALQEVASRLGRRLGLKKTPRIYTTSAHLSPLVWWTGRRVRVVIPAALLSEMDFAELRWILGHELAHVRRRDHLVRWLEWLACVCFWWNPVPWWARRNLRANEEACCDALVLSTLKPDPHTYASSLLNVVEFLSTPALRPPAVASAINSGGFLERRLEMIVSNKALVITPRWLRAGVLALAAGLLPLGVAYAQDYDAVGKRLREAVRSGEITREQAGVMMDALRRSAREERPGERRVIADEYARLEKRVADGEVSAEDARARLARKRGLVDERDERGGQRFTREGYARAEQRIKRAVEAGELSPEDARAKLRELREELGARTQRRSERREPAGQRRRRVEGERAAEDELQAYYARLGVSAENYGKIWRHLYDQGVERARIGEVVRGMTRVVHEIEAEGERFELDPRMAEYFEGIGLTDVQFRHVVGIARRIVKARKGEPVVRREGRDDQGRDPREEYANLEKRIKAAMKSGAMTEKEAKKAIADFRLRVSAREKREEARRKDPRAEGRTFTVEEYRRAAAKMKKLVDDGVVTAKDAERRLIEMRKRVVDEKRESSPRRQRR